MGNPADTRGGSVHSVDRVVSILQVLARLGAAGVTEIAAGAGVHEPTVVPAEGGGTRRSPRAAPAPPRRKCATTGRCRPAPLLGHVALLEVAGQVAGEAKLGDSNKPDRAAPYNRGGAARCPRSGCSA